MLIYPPKTYFEQGSHISEMVDIGLPVGLLYIAAVLEKEGHKVKVVDCLIEPGAKAIRKGDNTNFGIPESQLKRMIESFRPDIVGITGQFTAQMRNVTDAARLVKSVSKKILVFVGGPHVSVKGKEFMKENHEVDVAIAGEGEMIAKELVKAIENKDKISSVDGIIFRDKGKVIENKRAKFIMKLDDLPLPAYHLARMERYLNLSKLGVYGRRRDEKRAVSIITSRGCPNMCIFCSIHLHMGRMWRAHSAEYVLKHIDLLVRKYKVEELQIEDDNFTLDKKRCEAILDGMISRRYNISLRTPNGVRADGLDRSLILKMKKAGLKELVIAPESGDQWVLDNIVRKRMDLKKVIEVARICKEEKIPLIAWFIIGFPGETKQQIKNTLEFGLMLNRKYGVLSRGAIYATPLYGTELYDICDKKEYFVKDITPEALGKATMHNGEPLLKTEEFDPEFLKMINQLYIRKGTIEYIKRNWYHPFLLLRYAGGMKGALREIRKIAGLKAR